MEDTVYSFDVFDTCLTRPYIYPQDLFYDAAKLYLSQSGVDATVELAARISDLRISAQRHARRRFKYIKDVSLDDIYDSLAQINDTDLDLSDLKRLELELELSKLVPVRQMQHLVELCRGKGKVVFISDMYLPEETVQKALETANFWQPGDTLYLSNEIGKTKYSSELYHHVAAREGVPTSKICHFGDDPLVDVSRARIAGVQGKLFEPIQLSGYQKAALRFDSGRQSRSALGLIRSLQMQLADGCDTQLGSPTDRLMYGVMAPFLCAYVAWILQEAAAKGLTRLYFVSRDGQVLLKIAQKLLTGEDSIECRYLYGSRDAWFAPSIIKCDENDLYWAYKDNMDCTPAAILERLQLDWHELAGLLPEGAFEDPDEALDSSRLQQFARVLESKSVSPVIRRKSAELRKLVLDYFEQEGLLKDEKWAFVDVGWELNTQAAVKRILDSSGLSIEPYGFYMGVFRNHVPATLAGQYSAYFAQAGSEMNGRCSGEWFFRDQARVLLEHAFTVADHPGVKGYKVDGEIRPVFQQRSYSKSSKEYAASVHAALESYAELLSNEAAMEGNLDPFIGAANQVFRKFLSDPEASDVQSIAWLTTNIEQTEGEKYDRVLASPLTFVEVLTMSIHEVFPRTKSYRNTRHSWYAGSAALSAGLVRLLFKFLKFIKKALH